MNRKETKDMIESVRSEGDGYYSVGSEALRGWRYLCSPATSEGPATCTCENQRFKRAANPTHVCKHLAAVQAHLEGQHHQASPKTTQADPTEPKLLSMQAHRERLAERRAQAEAAPPKGLVFW